MKNRIITISREFGSGECTFGKGVAESYVKEADEAAPASLLEDVRIILFGNTQTVLPYLFMQALNTGQKKL